MNHYLFEDWDGEEFIVGAKDLKKAKEISAEYFGNHFRYICKLTDIEAEMSGLDEY